MKPIIYPDYNGLDAYLKEHNIPRHLTDVGGLMYTIRSIVFTEIKINVEVYLNDGNEISLRILSLEQWERIYQRSHKKE